MAKAPKSGSLRDFRVDSMSSHEVDRSAPSRRPSAPISAPTPRPSSSIKPTSFDSTQGLQEWDRSESFDQPLEESRHLWKSWEEDLNITEQNQPNARKTIEGNVSRSSPEAEQKQNIARTLVSWASDLALTERRMERRGEVEYSSSFQKQEMLKQQTTEYMRVLRSEFARSIEEFNDARQSGAHAIHLYSISNTENDFMLFRNGSKLVVSGQRSGRILFAFNQFLGQVYNPQLGPNFELEARWGPFDRLFWSYQSERVQVNDIIRFFLSEFVRQSYK